MLRFLYKLPLYFLGFCLLVFIRLIQPFLLIRIGMLIGSRIGHFVGNTEMYICEQKAGINVPNRRYVDLFFIPNPICNRFVEKIWKRKLTVLPSFLLAPAFRLNRFFPDHIKFTAGDTTQNDRDVFNLLMKYDSSIQFTEKEEEEGQNFLRRMGVPPGSDFVCLMVRDNAYLSHHFPRHDYSYHDYRGSSIQNYVEMTEYLSSLGFYVIRMGERVETAFPKNHPNIIDYANSNVRSDFMDVYLGSKCYFAISTGTGWDAIPEMTRKPIVFVNFAPIGYLHTSRPGIITLIKKYKWMSTGEMLSMSDIFSSNIAFALQSNDYFRSGIILEENSSEEITETVKEMVHYLTGKENNYEMDLVNQETFWNKFPLDCVDPYKNERLHGENYSRFSNYFLRKFDKFLT